MLTVKFINKPCRYINLICKRSRVASNLTRRLGRDRWTPSGRAVC